MSTAAVCGVLALRIDSLPLLVTLWWLTVVSVALAAVDSAVQRLPDVLTGLAGAGLAAGVVLTCVVEQRPAALLRAALAGLALFAGYCVLAALSPTSLGFGDCKLAAVLGVVTGFLGWSAVVTGTVLAFTLAAGYGLLLVTLRRTGRRDPFAFGPFMLVGTLVAILCAS